MTEVIKFDFFFLVFDNKWESVLIIGNLWNCKNSIEILMRNTSQKMKSFLHDLLNIELQDIRI